jgi:hypothetical protein
MEEFQNDLEINRAIYENIEKGLKEHKEQILQRINYYKDREDKVEEFSKSDEYLKINVGGKVFRLRLSLLFKKKDSLFSSILIKMWMDKYNFMEKGIFIDRDFEYFPFVIDYLMTGEIYDDDDSDEQRLKILEELYYYRLSDSYLYETEEYVDEEGLTNLFG